MTDTREDTELRDYIRVLWKRKWIVALSVLGTLGAALALTLTATPEYEATAKLFIGQRQVSTAQLQQGVQVSQLSQQLLETYAEVIHTRPIVERAIREHNLPGSAPAIASKLKAEPILNTQLLRLDYRHPDPAVAQATVNAVANAFVEEIKKIEGTTPATAGSDIDKPAINVSVVETALRPDGPVSPRPIRNSIFALLIGLMVGVGAVLLIDYLDTTVKHKDDIEDRMGLPVLASIPKIRTRVDELYLEGDNQSAFAETFRKLRTAIQLYGSDAPIQSILVTSPFAGEGKTTTSLNLAAVYAYAGHRTVLVEADVRRPSLHRLFPPNELKGLTMSMLDHIPLDEAIVKTSIDNLFCLPAGAIPPNPVEMLASDRMRSLLDELRRRFEVIVIDAPPMLPVADASTIATRVDGVVLVARSRDTRRDKLRESVQLVTSVRGRTLGIVLNAVPADESGGHSYQYYTSGSR